MANIVTRYFSTSTDRKTIDALNRIRAERREAFDAASAFGHRIGVKQALFKGGAVAGVTFKGKAMPSMAGPVEWKAVDKIEGQTIWAPSKRTTLGKELAKEMASIKLPQYEGALEHSPFKNQTMLFGDGHVHFHTIVFMTENHLAVSTILVSAPYYSEEHFTNEYSNEDEMDTESYQRDKLKAFDTPAPPEWTELQHWEYLRDIAQYNKTIKETGNG